MVRVSVLTPPASNTTTPDLAAVSETESSYADDKPPPADWADYRAKLDLSHTTLPHSAAYHQYEIATKLVQLSPEQMGEKLELRRDLGLPIDLVDPFDAGTIRAR